MTKMRNADIRAAEIRKQRAMYNMENKLDVPPGVAEDGFSYHNFRIDVKGIIDYRIEEAVSQGWSPVKADRSKVGIASDPLSRARYPANITRGDTMLMEIPTVIKDEIIANENKKSYDAVKSLKAKNIIITDEKTTRISEF